MIATTVIINAPIIDTPIWIAEIIVIDGIVGFRAGTRRARHPRCSHNGDMLNSFVTRRYCHILAAFDIRKVRRDD